MSRGRSGSGAEVSVIHAFLITVCFFSPYLRCHQNDIENVFPFILVGLLYVLCEPDLFIATLHFRIFTASRLLHTIVYLNGVRQPARGLLYGVGFTVIVSMLVTVLASGVF